MTVEEVFEKHPDLQNKYMDLVRSHRPMLELMHPSVEVERALSSYGEMKAFSRKVQDRMVRPLSKTNCDAIRHAMENRVFTVPHIDFHAPPGCAAVTDEELPFKELRVTGFGPEVPE